MPARTDTIRPRRAMRVTLVAGAFALVSACAAPLTLVATGPDRLDDAPDAATVTHADGLQLAVIAGSWTFRPRRVATTTVPLEFVVDNRSEFAWHIRYDDIRLVDDRGVEHAPIPPHQVPVSESARATVRVVALPEDTVRARERASGFVYFAPLPDGVRAIAVRWLPRRAFGQDRLDTLEVTFDVAR